MFDFLKAGIEINSLFSFKNIIPKAENILKNAMNVDKAKIFIVKKIENEEILATQDKTTEEIKNILRKIQF